jgi:NMD protein affecting ribosome stability and mRNA decay
MQTCYNCGAEVNKPFDPEECYLCDACEEMINKELNHDSWFEIPQEWLKDVD